MTRHMMCAMQLAFLVTDLMFQRMLACALFAGVAAGLIAAVLHFAFVQKYILLGELYETGALTHFSSGSSVDDLATVVENTPEAGHDHGMAAADENTHAADGHSHDAPQSDLQRNALTALFMVLVYVSYAMLLVAGFGLIESMGHKIGATAGLLWGLAGFVAFQMAPAIGLAPELPGTIAAELGARQLWWWGTAAATAAAFALLAYGPKPWAAVAALGLIAAPHIIGAPQPPAFFGVAPPEVSAIFAARVLATGMAVWAAMGWIAGRLWSRSADA